MKKHHRQEQEKYEVYLSGARLRFTPGRRQVFTEVMEAHGHFTAEDLVKQCNGKTQKVSRATIYRSLRELLESGVIRETAYGEKHQNYEHVYDEKLHHHARCVKCGRMLELPDLDEEKAYRPLLKKHGFRVLGHEMSFYGICKQCS
jgi:Fur family ferric uptake transcriptional regulator